MAEFPFFILLFLLESKDTFLGVCSRLGNTLLSTWPISMGDIFSRFDGSGGFIP
ncbi:hypothetical protein P1059_00901 [Pasteurella multocida subsp. gallicida P1059]|nr:hypothetical protein P1059_00901 [Pasteurella multocida subsp. gallicida P1059]